MGAFLELSGVTKAFGTGAARRVVLDGVDLAVERGEFVAILGCSGSGKSTLLSLLSGLARPDSGTVRVDGRVVDGPGADRAIVFQHPSLFPWLTVAENVRLAVDEVFPAEPPARRAERVTRMLELVHLSHAARKRPRELSGGMQQRVAVARAFAVSPSILLLDEPFSALDALTRATLQMELERLWEADQRTVVMITNDVDEALLLADRIVILTADGKLDAPVSVRAPRPREREHFDHDPALVQLRLDLADRLRAVGLRAKDGAKARREALESRDGAEASPQPARAARISPPSTTPRTAPEAATFLELDGVGKSFATDRGTQVIVRDVELAVRAGEFVSLLGHSGCGKTTVMNMVAGLVPPSTGMITLAGERIVRPGPDRAMVFQAHALLPWMTARENVLLGVDQVFAHAPRSERIAIADRFLDRVGLEAWKDARPAQLSAGMRQRVGVARAFALAPKLLLLDEPFGSLDTVTRSELQSVLLELWQGTGAAALLVTHDVDEALYLSDRILLMTDGPAAVIGETVVVPFARPRDRRALARSAEYQALRDRVLAFLERTSAHANRASATETARVPVSGRTA
ncbi:MAG: ABC transporter ATP-binding protein [Planctomycetes bacterium]|nr:ABC transporter ATP-binding protein [Planctomycetota bacterium]